MPSTINIGRYLLAVAVLAFGIEQVVFKHPLTAFIPMTGLPQKQLIIAVITGVLFVVAGLRIAFNFGGKYTAWFPCTLFFLLFLVLHLPALLSNIRNGGEWTVCFELVALGSGALIAVILNHPVLTARPHNNNKWLNVARILFAVSLIVFSGLHFIYADYIATLIPGWIPFHLFWSYFFGVAFIAAAASLLLQLVVHLSTLLLAIVFFVWVLVLHLPRCINNMHTEAEWTSLFVAFAMGSTALMFAGVYTNKKNLYD